MRDMLAKLKNLVNAVVFRHTVGRWGAMGIVAFGLAMVGVCSGCSGAEGRSEVREVAVSVPPLEYFVKSIGGDSVRVSPLLSQGGDPETFQPGMGAMRAVNRSGMLLVTGVLPFETELLKNLKDNTTDLNVCDVGEGIEYIYGTHSHAEAADGEEECGHGEPDPHIWSSVRNGAVIARNVFNALSGTYPELEPYFRERYDRLSARLDSIDRVYSSRLSGHPSFVIWHPSLSYFARDYGLEQIAFNIENKETSPLRLREVTDRAREMKPAAFFVPSGLPADRVATISGSIGLSPYEINVMSADWEHELDNVVNELDLEYGKSGNTAD